jgi:hyaluronoglucosaminidase
MKLPAALASAIAAIVAALALALALPPPATAGGLEWRAIVEGAYGAPWDHGMRERILRWMPGHAFNAYVHAPKDDLWQRTSWREPYPAAQQRGFDAEVALARARGIDWIPNLSPAMPLIPTPRAPESAPSAWLCFSCPEDMDAVLAKLEPFRRAGARTFMISFDDVTKQMSDPRDTAAYGGGDEAFGRANGDFLTRLLAELREREPHARLLTVGADYSGTADTDYLRGLRAALAKGIGVMWTGTNVPSEHWTPAHAAAYGKWIGRTPLVWDNWTNDDTAGNFFPGSPTARIFMGPYTREPDAAGAVGGIFLNPMNEADLNMLPLATAGDWMAAPHLYTARASWLREVRAIAGRPPTARAALRAWAETSWSNKLDLSEAPTFVRRNRGFLDAYRAPAGGWRAAFVALAGELGLVVSAEKLLEPVRNRAFVEQARPFLDAAAQGAGTGLLGARLLAAERPALDARRTRAGWSGRAAAPDAAGAEALRSEYEAGKQTWETSRRFTYGWRTPVAFEVPPYPVPRNVMDVWFDEVDSLDAAWRPHADEAAGSVALDLAGRAVRLRGGGRFTLPKAACGKRLTATDGAGGRTGLRLPACRGRR